jgi:hypothetical protein
MQNRTWPSFAKFVDGTPSIEAHSRGGEGISGHYAFARGTGAKWRWRFTVIPLATIQALQLRALLHSLRGPSGSVVMPMPSRTGTAIGTTTTASAASGAASLPLTSVAAVAVGDFMTVAAASGTQVVRATRIAGLTVDVRPRLRAAVASGAAVQIGAVTMLMRLKGQAPRIPLLNGHSSPFQVELEEVY